MAWLHLKPRVSSAESEAQSVGLTRPGAAPAPAPHLPRNSWHWQREDPLGSLLGSYPLRMFFTRHVGIDLGSRWVKYAVTRHGPGPARLEAVGGVPLEDSGRGEIGKIRAQVGALMAIRDRIGADATRWTVGLSGPGTIVRGVEVPRMPRRELAKAVRWQAQKKIPFSLDEAHVAVMYLRSAPGEPVRAIVAAALRRVVDDLLYLLSEAEIRPSLLTLPSFGFGRLLRQAGFRQPGEYCGLLDVGAERSLFAVYRGAHMEFFREIDLGIVDVEESLAEDSRWQPTGSESENMDVGALLFGRGVDMPEAPEGEGEDTGRFLNTALEKLIVEIQSTLEYYAAQSGGLRLNAFLLLGGGAEIPGIDRHLNRFLEVPVDLLGPRLTQNDSAAALPGTAPANWAAAYGYSLLPRTTPNLLPPGYLRELESRHRAHAWRAATSTALAASLLVTAMEVYRSDHTTGELAQLRSRIAATEARMKSLGTPDVEARIASGRSWLSAVSRRDLSTSKLLRSIADLAGATLAIDRIDVQRDDSGWAHVNMAGEVRTSIDQNEVVLARFINRLRQTGWFSHLRLTNFAIRREPEFERLTFMITARVPLEAAGP